jgi:hypothetical protein
LWLGYNYVQLSCDYKVYPICFAFHFNFVNYIKKCPKNIGKIQKKLKCNFLLGWTNQRGSTVKAKPKMK